MQRKEIKKLKKMALQARAILLENDEFSTADVLDGLHNAHKLGQINAPEYAEQVSRIASLAFRYIDETKDRYKDCVDYAASSTNTAFSRKVTAPVEDGLQTIRIGTRYETRLDIAKNPIETAIPVYKTIKPKAAKLVTGKAAKKNSRIDKQRAEKAERQRVAARERAERERAELVREVEARKAAHVTRPETPEQRQRRIEFEDQKRAAAIAAISPDNNPLLISDANPFIQNARKAYRAAKNATPE